MNTGTHIIRTEAIRRGGTALLAICVAALVGIIGCGEGDLDTVPDQTGESVTPEIPAFEPPATEAERTIDTVIGIDLDDDGTKEYIVGSLGTERMKSPEGRADRIEIFKYDTAEGAWKVVLSDAPLWVSSYRLREMTGDRVPELVVTVASGGNDPVTSNGVTIYTGAERKIRVLWRMEEGNPQLISNSPDRPTDVLIHGTVWPPSVPHAYAVTYVKDIHGYNGSEMVSVKGLYGEYFRKLSDSLLGEYREVRAKVEEEGGAAGTDEYDGIGSNGLAGAGDDTSSELFVAAASVMISLVEADRMSELRSFWNNEKDTLRRLLPLEQSDQLEVLYADKIM